MGKVTYFIEYYIPKTVKAQLSPYLPFWRVGGVRGREGGKRLGGGRIFFISIGKGKLGEKVVVLINNQLHKLAKSFCIVLMEISS